jgi:hypothetical protein
MISIIIPTNIVAGIASSIPNKKDPVISVRVAQKYAPII